MGFKPITKHILGMKLSVPLVDTPDWLANRIKVPVWVWMIWTQKEWILVDTGPPEAGGQLIEAVQELTQGKGVKHVVLTHAHFDHAGGLPALCFAWEPEIYCHEREADFLLGRQDYSTLKSHNLYYSVGRFIMEPCSWTVSKVSEFKDGDYIGPLRVCHLPGHTVGHSGFLHEEDRTVIAGDALINLRKVRTMWPIFSLSPEYAFRSLMKLMRMDFDNLLLSHGKPLMKNARARLKRFVIKQAGTRKRSKLTRLVQHVRTKV